MSQAEAIQAEIKAIQPLYDELLQLQRRWQALQTIEQAQNTYHNALATEEQELSSLEAEKAVLEREKHQLIVGSHQPSISRTRRRSRISRRVPRSRAGPQPRSSSPAKAIDEKKKAERAARRRLKKVIGRYKSLLDHEQRAQINRIAGDDDRALGEALILLPWKLFEKPLDRRERDKERLRRLQEWRTALADYGERLKRQIETQEMRYQNVLYLWQLWHVRHQGPQHETAWQNFLVTSCQAKQQEIAKLKKEVFELRTELQKLKAEQPEGGGAS